MKIAFVYDAVYPWEKGGAQKRIWELARRLATDHEVHIYGMHYWDGPRSVERDGVVLHGVSPPYHLYSGDIRAIKPALKFASKVARPLMTEEFDIVDCQQFPYFPCFVTKAHELMNRSSVVITWYEVWDDYWYDYLGKKGMIGRLVERATVRLTDFIIPISSYVRDRLADIGRTEGLRVVENGVNFNGIQSVEPGDHAWDVIYVGRLAEHKNIDVLLEALRLLKGELGPSSACIIGDGPERDTLERLAVDLGVDDMVDFKGFVDSDDEVIRHLKAAKVFVLPSTREGFPNTILEANACGVPCVVVAHEDSGAAAVVDPDRTGFVTELDAEAIADNIVRVITDEGLRQRLGEGAQQYGRNHDWTVITKRLEEVYAEIAT